MNYPLLKNTHSPERPAFEKWAEVEGLDISKHPDGLYVKMSTVWAFLGWVGRSRDPRRT